MKNRKTEVNYGTATAMSGKVTAGFDDLEGTGRALAVTIEPCQTVVRYGNDRTQVDVWYDSEMRPKRGTLIKESGFIDGTSLYSQTVR